MKCSLCGNDAAEGDRCVLCEKAFAAGQDFERERCAMLAEHCAHSCVTEGHCDAFHAAHRELAAQIRDR